jgi:hypothetical protein
MGFLAKHDLPEKVVIVCFDLHTYRQYTRALAEYLPRSRSYYQRRTHPRASPTILDRDARSGWGP